MNVKDYIVSGIIESYVLGLATGEERAEFERLCARHPELVAARDEFEESVEKFAMTNAVKPPASVKVRFLEAIQDPSSLNQTKTINIEKATTPVRPIRQGGFLRFIAAASVILLIGCAYFLYQFSSQNAELKNTNKELLAKYTSSDSILNQIVAEQKVVSDPNVTVVNLVGTETAPKSSANVYWDSASANVYLVVKNMPQLTSDKQYQLWALIDGKPKDLGVFDVNKEKFIVKMKNTQKAQAFAITIEQKGGAVSPTLEKMQSLGKLKESQ